MSHKVSLFAFSFVLCCTSLAFAQSGLEQELLLVSTEKLAHASETRGDAARGAILFHSTKMACTQCHRVDAVTDGAIGPNLAVWSKRPSRVDIVESILRPSAKIESTFASRRILTEDGGVYSGIVISRNGTELKLRTGPRDIDTVSIPIESIEKEAASEQSLMPAGLVQQLANRDQFMDLVAYVFAISEGGPTRAKELMPSPEQLQLSLPEYESHIDHAGFISCWNDDSLMRGEKIYKGLCVNCHGTRDAVGSLPTALRFGKGKFKKGSDPFSLYQTLTHGSGLMLPQLWMVPQQKYDVIQYLREEFLKDHDTDAYTVIDAAYLNTLPVGDTRGPDPVVIQPWIDMDYGNAIATTIEFGNDGSNIAQKAVAFRMDSGPGGVSKGRIWMAFEHDTMRWAAGWKGQGFINWEGIQFNGAHGIHPRAVGDVEFTNPTAPGWANPETRSFDDTERTVGRDGKRYGPLPKSWARYIGMRRDETDCFVKYSIDGAMVMERPFVFQADDAQLFYGRSILIGPRNRKQRMLLATLPGKLIATEKTGEQITVTWENNGRAAEKMTVLMDSQSPDCSWSLQDNRLCVDIAAGKKPARFSLALGRLESTYQLQAVVIKSLTDRLKSASGQSYESDDRVGKSPQSSNDSLVTSHRVWYEGNGWAVDELTPPTSNPWNARIRITGIAFYPDQDAMAVCTWDGDIWKVRGTDSLDESTSKLQWQRIATGLFQPLGILAYKDHLMVTCRDQLMKLQDTDGDGIIDDYNCFNNDHQVTEHFHEFAMGLQQDAKGNFYYAKSARHALKAVVPHHGTLLQVSPDGETTEILATGFRAANGVCLNADGTFVVTDQEGHWNPKNRINWVEKGKFYGNMFGYHAVTDSSDSAMEPPLCWITNSFDRSPAELLWADSSKWGALNGSLLNLSYGYGRVYVVPFEDVNGVKQGGMCALPIPDLPTGIIRGRFSPRDGQLYVGGMFAWASSRQEREGGLYRIRRTGQSVDLPIQLRVNHHAEEPSIEIGFSDPLDSKAAKEVDRYRIKVWDIKRSSNYGSDHLNENELELATAELLEDGHTLRLVVPDLKPTWCMSIELRSKTLDGREVVRVIHNTINRLP